MSRVETIQNQINELTGDELVSFREWLAEFDFTTWDAQIEADSKSGKLNHLAQKALQDHQAGRSTKL